MTLTRATIFAIAGAMLSSCASVQLISYYDEATDKGAAQLRKDVSAFVQRLSTAQRDEDRWFSTHQAFYEKAAVDLDALQLRAASIYKNSITEQQLELVEDNLAYMALLHKKCLEDNPSATPEQRQEQAQRRREAVREHGIDASLSCRSEYGADIDAGDRGKMMLARNVERPIKTQLDAQLGAVIALEDAKKRGKKE